MKNNKEKTNALFTEVGFGAAYFSVAIISVLFVATLFSFTVQAVAGSSSAAEAAAKTDWYKIVGACITPFALAVSGLIFSKSFGENPIEVCGMKKTGVKYYLYAVLLVAACFFGLSSLNGVFIEVLVKYAGYKYTETSLPAFSVLNYLLTVLAVCVLPAFAEEFFFRGILTRSLSGAGRLTASLICGAYFSLFHMNPAQTPYQFVTGFCFCLLALDSGSVFPTVLAHFLNNFIIVTISYAFPSFGGFTGVALIASVVFGLICLAAFLFLTLKDKVREGKSEYGYDYKTFFLYSAIGLAACVIMWVSGLAV